MNPNLIPILQRIIARDSVLRAFEPDNLPQAAELYLWKSYARGDTFLSHDEQEELESHLLPCGNSCLRESFRADASPDASRFHLFEDDSLLIETSAYQQVWSDARDYAVECILPEMRLTRMDADLLRAIGMEDAVDEVRQDFFHAFARIVSRELHLQYSEAREHWASYSKHLSPHEVEESELGGYDQGETEARDYLTWCNSIA